MTRRKRRRHGRPKEPGAQARAKGGKAKGKEGDKGKGNGTQGKGKALYDPYEYYGELDYFPVAHGKGGKKGGVPRWAREWWPAKGGYGYPW